MPPNRIYGIYSFSCLTNSVLFLLYYLPTGLFLYLNKYILYVAFGYINIVKFLAVRENNLQIIVDLLL